MDEWIKAAVADDTTVAELLMNLRRSRGAAPTPLRPLEWCVRQRRSSAKKQPVNQRASPKTPLSWSGATSVSGGSGGVGSEESSRLPIQKLIRSEVNEDVARTPSKRSRKKKTLAQLKDEESSLLREQRELKRRLSTIEMNLEKQRTENEILKRMKIESQPLLDQELTPLESDKDAGFVLPDLNIPFEDNPVSSVTCGFS